jgi:Flp pilus assembly protein TadG
MKRKNDQAGNLGLLTLLSRSRAGNTTVIMAAAILPIAAFVGAGFDVGRAYLVKSRLQTACDSGVLAGRRSMIGSDGTNQLQTVGNQFFDANFQAGRYGVISHSKNFTTSDQIAATGTAQARVPTTLMKMFGRDYTDVAVNCSAVMNLPNTDVMFVLDTTGSMATTNAGDSNSRIAGLRQAVSNFHANLEAAKRGGTQMRYGFVPYSSNVNVGRLLHRDWMVNNWTYQSRSWTPPTFFFFVMTSPGKYRYQPISFNVSPLKGSAGDGLMAGTTIDAAVGSGGSTIAVPWNGCIEERQTSYFSGATPPGTAIDLDIDRVPVTSDPATQWKPHLPGLVFQRGAWPSWQTAALDSTADLPSHATFNGGTWASCPAPARKLAPMTSGEVSSYLSSLNAQGDTIHDQGMLWGLRLLSPTGLFASENATTPSGGQITRHIIFMTDGETSADPTNYSAYGLEAIDQRRTAAGVIPTKPDVNTVVENRLSYLCTTAKARNISVWVIAFGTSLTSQLENCASDGGSFQANNTNQLNAAFTQIASKISNLRLAE